MIQLQTISTMTGIKKTTWINAEDIYIITDNIPEALQRKFQAIKYSVTITKRGVLGISTFQDKHVTVNATTTLFMEELPKKLKDYMDK